MTYNYKTRGTCSREIIFDVEDGHRSMCWLLHEEAKGADPDYDKRREVNRRGSR